MFERDYLMKLILGYFKTIVIVIKQGEKEKDPEGAADLLEQALTAIASFDICREHGIIVAESAADKVLPELPAPYRLYREYRYGKIRLSVYHRSGNEDETT